MKSYEYLYGGEVTVKLLAFTVKPLNLLHGSIIFSTQFPQQGAEKGILSLFPEEKKTLIFCWYKQSPTV